jgi:hypothetical protein
MRAYIQLIAVICAVAGCSREIECCIDNMPEVYVVADATVLDPGGAPLSHRIVSVSAASRRTCADTLQTHSVQLMYLSTAENGRVVSLIGLPSPLPLSDTDACVSFRAVGDALYGDTVVGGLDVKFRPESEAMDTVRVTIRLTAK